MSASIDDLVSSVRERLPTRWLGHRIYGHDRVASTNVLAREAVSRGEAAGTVFIADHQTKGRGRLGRKWTAEPGVNLTFSVLLHPSPDWLTLTGILAAVALRRSVDRFVAPVQADIKWPNDLLLEGLKCSGMLMEHVRHAGRTGVVLGIGINVNQTSFDALEAPGATSLLLATGRHVSRADLLVRILSDLEAVMDAPDAVSLQLAIAEFERHMYRRGHDVTLYRAGAGSRVNGRILGISADGALRLETTTGEQHFYAGDITTHPVSETA